MDLSTLNLTLKEFEIQHTSTPIAASAKRLTANEIKTKTKIAMVRKEGMELEFDMIGFDPSLVNAFRRILMSDVPTMAIEKVYMYNNTSIIQDEVLCQRLGLIPLRADPRKFKFKDPSSDPTGTEKDTLEFELKVKCKRPEYVKANRDNENLVEGPVYSKNIKWLPKGNQDEWITENPGPLEDDILLNKLKPGHELDMKLYAVKGIGRDHAKFSPVATAYYRLLPQITLKRDIFGEDAELLQKCFSEGVIELKGKKKKAIVKNARNDACSRNVFRHQHLKDAVELTKVRDHFIFTIESTGAMSPEDLFLQSMTILEEKCESYLKELDSNILKQ